jgi:SAM-dependent methyltransferase
MRKVKEFTEDWYNREYFADEKGKKFTRANGTVEYWGYRSPTGEVGGGDRIIEAWKTMFHPKTMLDVGAGRGQFVAYAREAGIEAFGFDWSQWAVDEGRFIRCKPEWLMCHDATKPWPYLDKSFDLVIALDLWEHIYAADLDFVVAEMFRVARKWIFLEIATVDGIKEKGYILKKGEPIPIAEDGRTWAGHVTVDTESFWIEKFERDDWLLRRDMVNWFFSLLAPATIPNWLLNTVIVLQGL